MKTARFLAGGRIVSGRLSGDVLVGPGGDRYNPDEVRFLLPFEPGKVIGIALNYRDHAAELEMKAPEEPALFWKPNTSLLAHRGTVIYPAGAKFMHYEVELAVVIGRHARRVREKDAYDYVGGYTIANDLVVRDFVTNTFRPPIRGKGWDTFGPLGPYLVSRDEIRDPDSLALRAWVNGELRQEGNTRDMVFKVPTLIEYISRFMTLEPGDVLMTGTPKGISHVHPGDVMRLEVEGLGVLENDIREEVIA
jgi:5-oxopent-3-ene-1,2,5-tricarboxylate decarboxylase/2-hydroxyhepta-2,4-diene-1,7-dioate isomerase